jgi:hypothetical protein
VPYISSHYSSQLPVVNRRKWLSSKDFGHLRTFIRTDPTNWGLPESGGADFGHLPGFREAARQDPNNRSRRSRELDMEKRS